MRRSVRRKRAFAPEKLIWESFSIATAEWSIGIDTFGEDMTMMNFASVNGGGVCGAQVGLSAC